MRIKTEKYHNQNRIQKEVLNFLNLFRVDKIAVQKLKRKGIIVYTPKLKKLKVGVASTIFIVCFITPFTPEFLIIPKLIRWVLK